MAKTLQDWEHQLFDGPTNLTPTERAAYVIIGLGLAAAGAKPRPNPLMNLLALAGGAYLAWSGYKGHCPARAAYEEQTGHSLGQPNGTGNIASTTGGTTAAGRDWRTM